MSGKPFIVAILAALSGIGVFQLAATSAQEQKSGGAEQEIRDAAAAFAAAFNKGDENAVLAFWTEDADYQDEFGKLYKGKGAIADMMKKNAAESKGRTMKLAVDSVKFTRPEVAIEEGVVTITESGGASGSNRYFCVWVKNDGRWQISSVRNQPPLKESTDGDESLNDLAWLIGEWSHQSGAVKVDLKCRWALNKRYLALDYDVKPTSGEPTQVAMWVGWDPASDEVRGWVFDSDGGNGDARWDRDGNTWTANCDGVICDGQACSCVNSIEFVDDDTFIWRAKNRRIAGTAVADSEVKFARRGGAAKVAEKGDK